MDLSTQLRVRESHQWFHRKARIPEFISEQLDWDTLFTVALRTIMITKDSPLSDSDILKQWHGLVHMSTHRDLTFATDRLPAISGIAIRFSMVLGEYCAGLWKSYLWRELLWIVEEGDRCPRPSEYQAPSWS